MKRITGITTTAPTLTYKPPLFALFSGQIAEAKQRLQITQLRRIANQFDNQGRQMAELERTRPWHYSNFNLEAYNKLGRLGEITGVDVWNFSLDDHSLRKGYSYVAGFVNSDTPWPWKDIDKMDNKKALVNIVSAARAWPEDPVFREKGTVADGQLPRRYHHADYPIKTLSSGKKDPQLMKQFTTQQLIALRDRAARQPLVIVHLLAENAVVLDTPLQVPATSVATWNLYYFLPGSRRTASLAARLPQSPLLPGRRAAL
ncbi:Alginate lyase [Serratia fonticola]|uniref:Alginate lyase n=1 Tax=Serratia fonticola TaxID=47917 RepID=A0A4U9UMB8_SERFO|nr:Alginate lyase [Serratia fonticola]